MCCRDNRSCYALEIVDGPDEDRFVTVPDGRRMRLPPDGWEVKQVKGRTEVWCYEMWRRPIPAGELEAR